MNITILRSYFPTGTNGRLYINGAFQCYTIELPWLNNKPRVSCIPEGVYLLQKRYSLRHGIHLQITGVPGRDLILIHAANNALQELKGCIAPVTSLLKIPGSGGSSKKALAKIYALIGPAAGKETLSLSIRADGPAGDGWKNQEGKKAKKDCACS